MFDKLVVSAKDRRRGETGKIFILTSVFYALAITSALVVSVVAASPILEDTSKLERFVPIIPAASRPPKGNPPNANRIKSSQPQKASIYNPAPLETITNPATQQKLTKVIPAAQFIDADGSSVIGGSRDGFVDGDPLAPKGGTVIGGSPHGETPPPPPVKPQARPEPQPQVQQQPVRLTSTVLSGKALERKTPTYPGIAKQAGVQGAITVEVVISSDGRVESVRALGGHPVLVNAALEAARGWRFQPTLLNGIPVRVTGVITFNFTLN